MDSQEIAKAVTTQDWTAMYVYLIATLIALIAIYAHARVTKSAELREINKNFKTALDQERQLTEITERVRHSFSKEVILYQSRVQSYNDKSITAIVEVYDALLQLRDAAKRFPAEYSNNNVPYGKSFIGRVEEFRQLLDRQKIWMTSELGKAFEEIAIRIDNACFTYTLHSPVIANPGSYRDEKVTEAIRAHEKFAEILIKELPSSFKALELDISKLVNPAAR